MRFHALASMPHYADHINAIFRTLPSPMQGSWQVGQDASDRRIPPEDVVLVAGFADVERAPLHRVIYIEHGAGQSYVDVKDNAAQCYHGSQHAENVVGYISPRKAVAERWGRPAIAIGAPICDPFELVTNNARPVATIAWHWDGSRVCPEAGTALEHYGDRIGDIVIALNNEGFAVNACVHPRDPFTPTMWARLGVEIVDADVARHATDVIIADNTSLMYELAYLGRGVVSLNAPWFRRDVHHGLRFWDAVPGLQIDEPDQLIDTIKTLGLNLPSTSMATRAAKSAYGRPFNDGHDGLRAATWLVTRFGK